MAQWEQQSLISQFFSLFETPPGLPLKKSHEHHIPLTYKTQIIRVKPYRYPIIQKNEIEKMLREIKNTRIIRNSNSHFASPVILVKKKDGTWRMCVDYKQLNKLTVKDKFPIPLVKKLLDELTKACWFSKLDLRSVYHQI